MSPKESSDHELFVQLTDIAVVSQGTHLGASETA